MDMDNTDKQFQCADCKKSYKRKSDLNRHIRSKREKIVCPICDHYFNRKDNFTAHHRRFHESATNIQTGGNSHLQPSKRTSEDQSSFPLDTSRKDKATTSGGSSENENDDDRHEITQSIDGNVTSIKIKPTGNEKFDLLVFYSNLKEKISDLIVSHSPARKGLKWYLVTRVEFNREREGQIDEARPHFRSITYRHLSTDDFDMHHLHEAFQKMFASKEEFIMKGSSWTLSKVIYLELCYVVYSPLKGGNYIKEPEELRKSRSLVNIKNNDQKCFLYSV
jgi:hypothetical protein